MSKMKEYSKWANVPANLKTRTQLREQQLKPKLSAKPKAHFYSNYYDRYYDLYEIADTIQIKKRNKKDWESIMRININIPILRLRMLVMQCSTSIDMPNINRAQKNMGN